MQRCAAAEEIADRAHGAVQLGFAGADAFEVEDVVDQAHQAVGVADGDVHHLAHLFGALHERAAGDEAERGAQRGERRAQLVRDGGDELVLHAVERVALGDVGEGDDDADGAAIVVSRQRATSLLALPDRAMACSAMSERASAPAELRSRCGSALRLRASPSVDAGFDLRAGDVLDGEAGAVLAPEDFVRDADGFAVRERALDGAIVLRIGRAVGVGVVDEVVHVRAQNFFGAVAEHLRGGGVDDGDAAFEVDAVDAVADGFEHRVGLADECAQLLFGANLLGDVDAEGEHVGRAAGLFDQAVAIGDDALFAVGVTQVKQALRFAGCSSEAK